MIRELTTHFNVTLFDPWNQLELSRASGGVYSKVCSDLESIKRVLNS